MVKRGLYFELVRQQERRDILEKVEAVEEAVAAKEQQQSATADAPTTVDSSSSSRTSTAQG